MWASLGMAERLQQAQHGDEVFLPRLVPGWQGAALAVAGAALGEGWALLTRAGSAPTAWSGALGWLALMLIFMGLLLQMTQWRCTGGWTVRITERRVVPANVPGEPVWLDDSGAWALACVSGDRFRSIAIDLRHAERGRVARLFQSPARTRLKDIRACSALTDELARRLGVAREGLVA